MKQHGRKGGHSILLPASGDFHIELEAVTVQENETLFGFGIFGESLAPFGDHSKLIVSPERNESRTSALVSNPFLVLVDLARGLLLGVGSHSEVSPTPGFQLHSGGCVDGTGLGRDSLVSEGALGLPFAKQGVLDEPRQVVLLLGFCRGGKGHGK